MCMITLTDLSLSECTLTPRVAHLREVYFQAMPEICVERPSLITDFALTNGHFQQDRLSILDKAHQYRYVLQNRTPVVRHTQAVGKDLKPLPIGALSLFAGSTTSKFKGVLLYPEFLALSLWPELWDLPKRKKNPYYITDKDVHALNADIFPRWMDRTIMELARKGCYKDPKVPDQKTRADRADHGLKLLERLVFFLASKVECISHTIPDFSRAINEGLGALIKEAKEGMGKAKDQDERGFYEAIATVLEGIVDYSHHLAAEAKKLALAETDPAAQQELLEFAAIHDRVPEGKAETFREGLTTLWTVWTAIHLENPNIGLSLGRLDQILYPLYRADIDRPDTDPDKLTVPQAIELLCCLWLKIGDHVPMMPQAGEQLFGGTGSNQAITIGGVKADNATEPTDAVNDLTYVILRAIELMELRDPNLNARYYAGVNPPEYLRRLCEANINTGATPALHNDRAVIAALTAKGETLEQARDYGVIGCVEPGSNGRFYGHTAAILLNLTSVLEMALFNGRHRHTDLDVQFGPETGDSKSFANFDKFLDAFAAQTHWLADETTALNDILGRVHQSFYPTPILSAFFEGPMKKGMDIIQGGATINSSGVAIIGLADVVDSLAAIKRVVFDQGFATFLQLRDAIQADFQGYEVLRARLCDAARTPKYGNDDPAADDLARKVVELLETEFAGRTNYRDGHYRVGYWTMTNHAGFGRLMGAFPNGRKKGENFASGITPVSGATAGLTAALASVARLPAPCLSNGVALNLKFTPADGEHMLDHFVQYVEAYLGGNGQAGPGGMEIQFNVTDHETFKDAVAHRQDHTDLLVRVSGYTAYFVELNPQMQQEIVDRTEYRLSTGAAVPYPPFPLPQAKEGN